MLGRAEDTVRGAVFDDAALTHHRELVADLAGHAQVVGDEEHGEVEQCTIIMDRDTGRSKGFGFVVMPTRHNALEAIKAMNGIDLDGRKLNVNESKPKPREEGGRRHARR